MGCGRREGSWQFNNFAPDVPVIIYSRWIQFKHAAKATSGGENKSLNHKAKVGLTVHVTRDSLEV